MRGEVRAMPRGYESSGHGYDWRRDRHPGHGYTFDTAENLCREFGLKLATFRCYASRDNWRRTQTRPVYYCTEDVIDTLARIRGPRTMKEDNAA